MDQEQLNIVVKAFADPQRVRAVMALRGGELCACRISAFLELAPSTVSKHMGILRSAGIVRSRKKGKWVYYRLSENLPDSDAGDFTALIVEKLKNDHRIRDDEKTIKRISADDPEISCGGEQETSWKID